MKNFYENSTKLEENLYRFRESITLDSSRYQKLPLTEKEMVIKEKDKEYKVNSAYRFKIWEIGKKNLNNRCYDKVVEKIVKEKATTLGFANHPDDEGDVTKTYAVQKNPHIYEGWLCINNYFVGEYGRLAEEILDRGGNIGVSSSALGDVNEEGYIMEENFTLERYGDWVDFPSNNHYHSKEESLITEEGKKKENIEVVKESLKNKNEKNKAVTKAEEKNFVKSMKKWIEEVDKKEIGIETRINEYKELKEMFYFNEDNSIKYGKELYEDISSRIEKLYCDYKSLAEKGKNTDKLLEEKVKLDENNKTLDEKYEFAVELIDSLKSKNRVLIETVNKLQEDFSKKVEKDTYLKIIKALKETISKNDGIKHKYDVLLSKNKKLKEENYILNRESKIEKIKRDRDDRLKKETKERNKQNIRESKISRFRKNKEQRIKERNERQDNYFSQYQEINEFYKERLLEFPELGRYKNEILNCKTLFEAEKKFIDLQNFIYNLEDKYEKEKTTYFDRKIEETKRFLENTDNKDNAIITSNNNKRYGRLF